MDADSKKFQTVSVWLKRIYGHIPNFEINATTIDLLCELACANEKADKEAHLLIAEASELAAEYHARALKVEEVLRIIGCPPERLSATAANCVKLISSLALTLGLGDCEMQRIFAAIVKLAQELDELSQQLSAEKEKHSDLTNRIREILKAHNELQAVLKDLNSRRAEQEVTVEKRLQNIAYMQSKSQEYEMRIQELQERLQSTGVIPELFHSALVDLVKDVEQIRNELKPKLALLQSYQDLPPDFSLARIRIEQAKAKLQSLEEQILQSLTQTCAE